MSAIYDFECERDNFEMMEDQDAFSMNEGIPGPGVPAGGSAGQILQKRSQEDYDTEWVTPDGYVPAGGSAGQILKKSSAADYDTEWDSLDAGDVSFDSSLTYAAGSVGKEICDVKNTLNHKADLIYDTASGDIASFPDGADGLPVKDLTVAIEPVQSGSGDPSPTNVRPISGWTGCNITRTGKNLLVVTTDLLSKPSYYSGNWYSNTRIDDNSMATTRSDSQGGAGGIRIKNVKAGTYTFLCKLPSTNSSKRARWGYKGINGTVVNNITLDNFAKTTTDGLRVITLPIDCEEVYFRIWGESSDSPLQISKMMFVRGTYGYSVFYNNFQFFENCKRADTPISWQSEAGTVYGGTLDVTTGVLTVTDANIASYNGETLTGEWISDRDVYAAGTTPTTGAQVVYKLATPQAYQLTPQEVTTLLGQNNIWADCGPSTVEYPADTKLYIQKINTPSDDDMIADANIASGQYFIVNNNLYLSTAAILAGDPIKPGTNCTLTNLAAALNALNS